MTIAGIDPALITASVWRWVQYSLVQSITVVGGSGLSTVVAGSGLSDWRGSAVARQRTEVTLWDPAESELAGAWLTRPARPLANPCDPERKEADGEIFLKVNNIYRHVKILATVKVSSIIKSSKRRMILKAIVCG